MLLKVFKLLGGYDVEPSVINKNSDCKLELITVGHGRTGTVSLRKALQILGYNPYHQAEVFSSKERLQSWDNVVKQKMVIKQKYGNKWYSNDNKNALIQFTEKDVHNIYLQYGFNAAVCVPTLIVFKEILQLYPDMKVILTKRDANKWYTSVMKAIYPMKKVMNRWFIKYVLGMAPVATFIDNVMWNLIFDDKAGKDKEYTMNKFDEWNNMVIDYVKKDNLLVYQPGDGWEPLCTFLGKPIPDVPYPRSNSKENVAKIRGRVNMFCDFINGALLVLFFYVLYYFYMK
mmetsp:Transcript_50666/g.62094  ORF Transcript_50666/g.62094 Transcript_50666/m.62094 type:complete len:287 (+) Transcript_50666:90-950(+)